MAENDREIILSREGLLKLESELEHLKTVRREEVAERIKQAIAFGDISENSEYEDAKNEQAFIEGKIINLERTLKNARLIEETDIHTDIVSLGSRVTLKDVDSGREIKVTLVASVETKITEGKISEESPVGAAIIGQPIGTIALVEAPKGMKKYEILNIEK